MLCRFVKRFEVFHNFHPAFSNLLHTKKQKTKNKHLDKTHGLNPKLEILWCKEHDNIVAVVSVDGNTKYKIYIFGHWNH